MSDTPIYDQLRWELATPAEQLRMSAQNVVDAYARAFRLLARGILASAQAQLGDRR